MAWGCGLKHVDTGRAETTGERYLPSGVRMPAQVSRTW